ncbi:MAG: DEAD/DEAH box helicase [Lentimicrobiaceae bacterium]|jgi:ATP-dependent RNA helicase DeaD|nr:DEAD/DEAH box helicase [Lentimicrobiaceae bacterium]MCP4909853.1 DEAD/DEAH box helicase [Bacteroidota bacterium]MBT3455057.1 DEAD/DEAH box helicase [Lentimicrobiaceae bacterium]MBT3818173.1 DEAD/DEAH box helicase [Lentimicrobiaceae bacterium]MBT4061719.1 DEAD/DEAH box helicase [Lentimicrobiaceae bacterium]
MNGFKELNLSDKILSAVEDLGFVTPTPIQAKVIPILLESDKDLVGLAQTGTGKTAAFGLPMIQKTNLDAKSPQGLILSPTRELCIQIAKDLEKYSVHTKKLRVTPVYGGSSIDMQIKDLKKGTHIVVGTPGRTLDLIKRNRLEVGKIKTLVLDEADEMLTMGFKEELNSILEKTPKEKQTLLFSATMPAEIKKISKKFLTDPVEITTGVKNNAAENVKHIFCEVHAKDRYEALKRIADVNPKIYGIIFCRTRRETKEIADKLINDGYNADALHGDLSQAQRDMVMNKFRIKHLQLLVATDVAARGLDVNDLTHVINFNLPDENEVYVHRSGRTGRAGKKGISLSILHMREKHKLRAVEKIIGRSFEKYLVPSGKDICQKQLFNLVDKVENVEIDESQIAPFMEVINKKLGWMDREELIKKFVSVEFNRFLSYYKGSRDLNKFDKENDRPSKRKKERNARRDINPEIGFSRFFINAGSSTNLTPPSIIGLINKYTRERNIDVGRIEIMKNFSFFEVDSAYEDKILKSLNGGEYHNIPLIVEIANPKSGGDKAPKNSKGSDRSRGFDRKNSFNRRNKRNKRNKS